MDAYFLDSSGVTKHYASETDTAWIDRPSEAGRCATLGGRLG